MTTRQAISDVRNLATSGSNPVEFRIEDSQILFWYNEIRAMLISQAIQKKQDITDSWVQTINCLEMEQVDKSECCDIVTNCYILKSIQEIPRTIETTKDNTLLRVSTPIGKVISRSNPFEARYNNYNKYTKNKAGWFIKNNHLYIINEETIKYVDVDLLAENPSDLASYNSCSGDSCFNDSSDYPCSLKMASQITDIVLKTKIYPYLQTPQDNKNDASNDASINPKN